jgi:hypothetical protein
MAFDAMFRGAGQFNGPAIRRRRIQAAAVANLAARTRSTKKNSNAQQQC